VRNKSTFIPPRGRNHQLDNFIDHLTTSSNIKHSGPKTRPNTTYKERKALEELRNNHNIIIKEADKGGAIVIMDRDYYEEKIAETLADIDTYKEISNNVDKITVNKINKLVQKYELMLTKKEKDYLQDFESKTSNFYGLPKVHKSQEIIQAIKSQQKSYLRIIRPTDLKFRPIVAGPSCPTHRLSNLLDILLKPFVHHVKSYVRDDIDFLTQIPQNIGDTDSFVTFDITSLYSNISKELGLKAIEYWLVTNPETLHHRFSKDFIVDSLNIILDNNYFCFADKHYLQIHGTAMGTKMAPTYANLTLAYLEETLYTKLKDKYTDTFSEYFEKAWKRYLDDCFIIWDNSVDNINSLHIELNNLHPKLKFTMEQSETEISFLDITLKQENGNIITDIYHKATDTKQYLHFKSCHPRTTKNNIPYNLARRICTIVIEPGLRKQRLK
jgi:hypothetical protein